MSSEDKIDNITEVKIIKEGRGIQIQFGNNTHFIDKRDLYNLPSWNDRADNRKETLVKLTQDIENERRKK